MTKITKAKQRVREILGGEAPAVTSSCTGGGESITYWGTPYSVEELTAEIRAGQRKRAAERQDRSAESLLPEGLTPAQQESWQRIEQAIDKRDKTWLLSEECAELHRSLGIEVPEIVTEWARAGCPSVLTLIKRRMTRQWKAIKKERGWS